MAAVESLGPIATFVYKGGSYQYFNTLQGSNIDPWYNVKKAGTVVVEGELFGIVPAPIRPQTTDNANGNWQYPGAVEYLGVWELPVYSSATYTNYTRGTRLYWIPAAGTTEGYLIRGADIAAAAEDKTYVCVGLVETSMAQGDTRIKVVLTPGAATLTVAHTPG